MQCRDLKCSNERRDERGGCTCSSSKVFFQAKTARGFILDHALSARGSGVLKTSSLPLTQKHQGQVGGRGVMFPSGMEQTWYFPTSFVMLFSTFVVQQQQVKCINLNICSEMISK